jgi:cobalt-zinc-cadmium efflux system outer membrane protein
MRIALAISMLAGLTAATLAYAQPDRAAGQRPRNVFPAGAAQGADPPPSPAAPLAEQITPAQAAGAQPAIITLADVQSIALANNPTLAQSASRVDAARGRWLQAGLYPNPSVGYMAEEIGMAGTAGMQGVGVSQEIVRGGKLSLDRAAASYVVVQTQQEFEAQRLRVLNDAQMQFYNLLVAQRAMEINDELAGLAQRGFETVERLYSAEEASRVDVLQARVERNTVRLAADNARNRYQAAWRRLAAVIGAPTLQPVKAVGDLEAVIPELSWDESLAKLLATSPELAAAQADVQRACWTLRREQAEPIGNINLQIGAQHDNESGDNVASVTAMVPVPIHNRNQGAVRAAAAELRAAQADVARLELELQTRLAAVFERYANARQQVDRYAREVLPDARTSLELVTRGYREGELAYLALLESQRTLSRANLVYLSALEQLWESSIAIEGLVLTDSLKMTGP